MRAKDIGSQFPSDLADDDVIDPSSLRSELDYSIQVTALEPTVTILNRTVTFGNGIVATIGTIVEDFSNGYCIVSFVDPNGVAKRERAYLGFYRARRGDTVVLQPANLAFNARWLVASSLVGEIKFATPTASELNAIGGPPIDDYYNTLGTDQYI